MSNQLFPTYEKLGITSESMAELREDAARTLLGIQQALEQAEAEIDALEASWRDMLEEYVTAAMLGTMLTLLEDPSEPRPVPRVVIDFPMGVIMDAEVSPDVLWAWTELPSPPNWIANEEGEMRAVIYSVPIYPPTTPLHDNINAGLLQQEGEVIRQLERAKEVNDTNHRLRFRKRMAEALAEWSSAWEGDEV